MPEAISRRRLISRGIAATVAMTGGWRGALGALGGAGRPVRGFGPVARDPERILDLPSGFSYRILARAGDAMSDGLRVPGLADGMHAFDGGGDRTILLCNHELDVGDRGHAFAGLQGIPPAVAERMYDRAIGAGGVTTLWVNRALEVERHFLSLAGTLRNCAGGATPWGSWVSCEESVVARAPARAWQDHGFAFEVPASATGLVPARPLVAMGRFHREAVAVDPATGIVYQTEDREDGLFYRFRPDRPGDLAAGGRLEALAVVGLEGRDTGNREVMAFSRLDRRPVRWVGLDDPRAPGDDLRVRGRDAGASTFVRGEGMAVEVRGGETLIWFKCTTGGPREIGQLWCYRPSPAEGGADEARRPGILELFLEPDAASIMNQGDNVALTPWGDLLVCEDNTDDQRLIGVTADGGTYVFARNPRANSEFAGATFAPAGDTLFVNLQIAGLTFAIRGPWSQRSGVPVS